MNKLLLAHHLKKIIHNFDWYGNIVSKTSLMKDNLLEFPIINQEILERNYYNSSNSNLMNPLMYQTSGTSMGLKKNIYYSNRDHLQYIEKRKATFKRNIKSSYSTACSDLGTGHAADSANAIFTQLGLRSLKIDYSKPLEEHIESLNKNDPDILFTMPVILQNLINSEKLKFNPKKVFLVGDIATRQFQSNVASFFNIKPHDIIDLYGSIEIGAIAYFNHEIGMYQFEDHIYPEQIALQGDSCLQLILTSLNREYFPSIRYASMDITTNLHLIKYMGKESWFFERLLGRIGSELKAGEKLSIYDLLSCIEYIIPNVPFNIEEKNYTVYIYFPISKINKDSIDKLSHHLRNINPSINQMIRSGLTPDFNIIPVEDSKFSNSHFKRRIQKL